MAIALADSGPPKWLHQSVVNVIIAAHITLINVPLDVESPLRAGNVKISDSFLHLLFLYHLSSSEFIESIDN